MNIRRAAGPLALICLAVGALYAAFKALTPAASMGAGFLVIGVMAAGFACAIIFGGIRLDQFFLSRKLTSVPFSVVIGLVYAVGASAMVLGFFYIGFFAPLGLVICLLTAASLYWGARLALGARQSISPLLYALVGVALALGGIMLNAFLLYRLA